MNFFKISLIRPPECHHHFSVATLVGVLKRATQKRKFIRDEKTVDRLEAKDRETSRSDSQASEAPSKIANPQQSVTGELKLGYLEILCNHIAGESCLVKKLIWKVYLALLCYFDYQEDKLMNFFLDLIHFLLWILSQLCSIF